MSWRPVASQPPAQADTACFLATLEANSGFFERAPLVIARAPGRLDVIGGFADYSGALVLELPLGLAAFVALQRSATPALTIRSLQARSIGAAPEVTIALADLAPGGAAVSYARARVLLASVPQTQWAAYLAGALVVLARERGLALTYGLRLLVDSQIPLGKGVSSSAAIEVAAMQAIAALHGCRLAGRELALLCQKAENLVVGAPCGVMDQMTAACGEQGALLALLCQPAELQPPVALPPGLEFWGIDSGIRHAVTGTDYGAVRAGAFMGYRMIAELEAGGHPEPAAGGQLPWGGYLANITPSAWEQRYRQWIPEALNGAAFLARYGGTTDPLTQVEPSRTYAVRSPTAHPIEEHQRARLFRALLHSLTNDEGRGRGPERPTLPETALMLGELMYQSHASYSACGLGSDGTDLLVDLVRAAGPQQGLYGAKITGSGSGGTVAVLARRGSDAAVRAIAQRYERETGRSAMLLSGSSPGAAAFGALWLEPE
jgi:galactokinase